MDGYDKTIKIWTSQMETKEVVERIAGLLIKRKKDDSIYTSFKTEDYIFEGGFFHSFLNSHLFSGETKTRVY